MLKSVKVRDYMTQSLITFRADTEIFEAINTLITNKISGAPVIDENKHLVGIFSEGDCLTAITTGIYYEEVGGIVGDYMSKEVQTVGSEDDIVDIAIAFQSSRRRRFPVLEEGELVGQISQRDVLRAVIEFIQNPPHHD